MTDTTNSVTDAPPSQTPYKRAQAIAEMLHETPPLSQTHHALVQALGEELAELDSLRAMTCGLGDELAELDTLRTQLAEAQRDSERLDWMIEQFAYVVSDPDCCDGYWLNYLRPDGTLWTQATGHETPRAAIDAAKGEGDA